MKAVQYYIAVFAVLAFASGWVKAEPSVHLSSLGSSARMGSFNFNSPLGLGTSWANNGALNNASFLWFPFKGWLQFYSPGEEHSNPLGLCPTLLCNLSQQFFAMTELSRIRSIRLRTVIPKLTVGWGSGVREGYGLGVKADIGSLEENHLHSVPEPWGACVQDNGCRTELEGQANEFNRRLSQFKVSPLFTMGVLYKF